MFFNFSTWLPEALSNKDFLLRDFVGGITIAMIIIPQSMAYATLAGLEPIYGLYASLIPVGIAAIFGSSRYLATGPVAMVCLLTSVAISSLASGQTDLYIYFAILLAFLVGLFQIILSLSRAGYLFDKIPEHVLLGFTSAAALIISMSQLSKVFGMPKISFMQLADLNSLLEAHPISVEALSLSIIILLFMYIVKYKLTISMIVSNLAVFFAVVISILISTLFIYKAPIVGHIPAGLPDIKLPSYDFFKISIPMLIIHTIIISFVGFMEAIAIAKQLHNKKPPKDDKGVELFKDPTPINTNQELFGQGFANISSGLSGSLPVSGSFSRSAVSEACGSYSGFSSVITMIVVGLTLLYATPLLYNLPEATLGIIVIFAVIPLIRIKEMKRLYNENKELGSVAWITFISTLMFPLLSWELFEGITTHIWTGIIFGFIVHIIFSIILKDPQT
jgi:SulP family sulfate permease